MTEVLDYQRVGPRQVSFHDLDTSRRELMAESDSLTLDVKTDAAFVSADWTHVNPDMVEDLPRGLVDAYAERACLHALTQQVDPGVWCSSVVGLDGAYGDGASADEAEGDLRAAVVGWVAVRRRLGLDIPILEGLDLNIPRVAD